MTIDFFRCTNRKYKFYWLQLFEIWELSASSFQLFKMCLIIENIKVQGWAESRGVKLTQILAG